MATEVERPTAQLAIEKALRHLGTRSYGRVVDLLEHALERPGSRTGVILAPLIEPTAALEGWSSRERAEAVWRLMQVGIVDRDVSPTTLSRRRHALYAAFRLPDEDVDEEWGASLTDRFKQLMALKVVFGGPTTTQPMEVAWRRGVQSLSAQLAIRFATLKSPGAWEAYRSADSATLLATSNGKRDIDVFRKPSRLAQAVFMELFVITVYMRGRISYRRTTERLITARADIEFYTARQYMIGENFQRTFVPAIALWGCRAEVVTPSRPGEAPTTRLWFPRPLKPGEQAYFATETIFDAQFSDDRDWVDVDVDHHGIARGETIYDGRLPTRGLTIRIHFDVQYPPAAVWWYAEANEDEREVEPPIGDPQLLNLIGNEVQKTFTEPCQPRDHYGIAFRWPDDR